MTDWKVTVGPQSAPASVAIGAAIESGIFRLVRRLSARRLAHFPQDAFALNSLGYCYETLGDYHTAATLYERMAVAPNVETPTPVVGKNSSSQLDGCHKASLAHTDLGNAWEAALWHDRGWYGRSDYNPPDCLELRPVCVKVEWSIGECLFHVTRLPPSDQFELCQSMRGNPGKDATTLERLRPSMERAGYHFCEPRKPFFCAATASVLLFGEGKPIEQRGVIVPPPDAVKSYRAQLSKYPRPWIGFSWVGGNLSHWSNANMVQAEDAVAAFRDLPGTLIDLQHQTRDHHEGPASQMRDAFRDAGRPLIQVPGFNAVTNTDDALGLFAVLDMTITTDNSNPYIIAALRRPAFVMLNHSAYQYMSRACYWPTLTRVRQPRPGDWKSVLSEVREKVMATPPAPTPS